jgi:hypothetical protein
MPYLNLDDDYPDHRKIDALSDGAFRLHTAALCYCAKNLTDGVIDGHRVPRLTRTYKAAHVKELTDAGLWRPHVDGYEAHDYLDWNKSRDWWLDKRKKDAERKAAWRAMHPKEES